MRSSVGKQGRPIWDDLLGKMMGKMMRSVFWDGFWGKYA
jgi:hypothetical protein